MALETGKKYNVVIDTLDLRILLILTIYGDTNVLSMVDRCEAQHKTVKAHIDKLFNFQLINIEKKQQNKKLLSIKPLVKKFIIEYSHELKPIMEEDKISSEFLNDLKKHKPK
jgi:hypothetical protein